MADEKAAFGVFPQMAPRRSRQDREAAKNVPVDFARGLAAGALGQVGDVESLIRMLPGLSENTFFPTSEEILAKLPFGSNTPVSRAASGLGVLGGNFYNGPGSSMKALMGVPGALKKGFQDFLAATAQGGSKIFIGPKHKSWDQLMADRAVALEKQGVEPAVIWRETGTYRAPDGKLRQEISDDKAVYNNPVALFDKGEAAKNKVEELRAILSESSNLKTGQKDLFPKELTAARKPVREEMSKTVDMRDELKRDPARFGHRSEYVLEHPELYAGMPELANVRVYQGKDSPYPGVLASADTKGRQVDIYKRGLMSDPDKSMIHELQHVVQDIEGFSPGASSLMAQHHPAYQPILDKFRAEALIPAEYDEFLKLTKKVDSPESQVAYEEYKLRVPQTAKNLDDRIKAHAAGEWYKRTVGETEARNAEKRMNMTPEERRATFPGETADVPFDQQIPLKEGGAVRMDKGGAAFGVFPQMSGRRSKQDREAAKNVPVDLARGALSGVLGAPGDIESLVRMLPGLSEETILPTSEDIEKRLPFKSDTPVSRAATGLGQLAGGFYGGPGSPLRLAGALPGAVKQAAKDFAQATVAGAPHVIKPKGGNWLSGNVEKQLGRMKMADTTSAEKLAEDQQAIDTARRIMGNDPTVQRAIAQMENELAVSKRNNAINNWIDRNLTNYVKKEMGTPEDPVRKLAEEGVLHIKPIGDQYEVSSRLMNKRKGMGFSPLGEGRSEPARFWEKQADISIDPYPAGSYKHGSLDEGLLEANPWLKNVPDDEIISYAKGLNDLGFDHIVDVLRQDVREGRIRPEQLNKVSMEQAVRRTYEYDQEMAKKMREAQIKATEGMPIHKEYPEGYKWIELTAKYPEQLPEGFGNLEQFPKAVRAQKLDEPDKYIHGANVEDLIRGIYKNFPETKGNPEKAVADALKYEGETMGHCVGGYCPDVLEGRSRIFSLRDAKGEPHVTVEVRPSRRKDKYYTDWVRSQPENIQDEITAAAIEYNAKNPSLGYGESLNKILEDRLGSVPDEIIQIKGKQNRAPKEEYLPYVQDFVRGGKWSDVGDITNTGLRNVENWVNPDTAQEYRKFGLELPKYATDEELEALHKQYESLAKPDGMASGGSVKMSSNPDVMRLELAGGGAVKEAIAKLAKAAKEAKEAAVPLQIPRVRPTQQEIMEAAERVGRQQAGDFVRSPLLKGSSNLAGRSKKEVERLKALEYKLKPIKELPKSTPYEAKVGDVNIALPGDQTVADMLLEHVGDTPIGSIQEGGAKFGLGRLADPEAVRAFWASNEGPASMFQNKVSSLAKLNDTDNIIAHHLAMGQTANNFAQHLADANMRAIDYSRLTKRGADIFDSHIAAGYKDQKGRNIIFPDWPGIANPEEALEAMRNNPALRKWFNDRMKTAKLTSATNMPSGKDIEWAVTEPELRNMEINLTGLSVGKMKPESSLIADSAHKTYSHDIPGTALGHAPELAPFSISFPDVTGFVREQYRPQDFTGTIQKVFPHQIVDEAYLEDMDKYYRQLRKVRGFKKGGTAKKGAVKKAGGGEITAEDLEIEERPLR